MIFGFGQIREVRLGAIEFFFDRQGTKAENELVFHGLGTFLEYAVVLIPVISSLYTRGFAKYKDTWGLNAVLVVSNGPERR